MNYRKLLQSASVELQNVLNDLIHNQRYISESEEIEILKSLRKNGYYVLENFFTPEWCQSVIVEIERLIEKYPDQIWIDKYKSDHRIYGADKGSKLIRNYFNEKTIISLLQSYEGRKVKDGFVLGAKLRPIEGNIGSGGGWHRDHANVKQSKSIVYLTDVTNENGPFQYIEGSHLSINIYKDSFKYKLDQFQNRFTDSEVEGILTQEPSRLKTLTGKAGTVILTDTRGIHRGKPIQKGLRYALTNYLWTRSNIPKHISKHIIKTSA